MRPLVAIPDVSDGGSCYANSVGKHRLVDGRGLYERGEFGGEFCHPVSLAPIVRPDWEIELATVANSVLGVVEPCAPLQIGENVVGAAAVEVPAFLIRTAFPDECGKNESVYVEALLCGEANGQVPVLQRNRLKYISGLAVHDAPKIRNTVIVAGDRQPTLS